MEVFSGSSYLQWKLILIINEFPVLLVAAFLRLLSSHMYFIMSRDIALDFEVN